MIGSVTAIVGRLGEPNANGIQFEPGSVREGLVMLSPLGHAAHDGGPVAGIGEITVRGEEIRFAGRFDFGLPAGRIGYEIVLRGGSELQWSIGVNVLEEYGRRFLDGRQIRIIERCHPVEVSPVLYGAYPDSCTLTLDGRSVAPARRELVNSTHE